MCKNAAILHDYSFVTFCVLTIQMLALKAAKMLGSVCIYSFPRLNCLHHCLIQFITLSYSEFNLEVDMHIHRV